MTKKAKPKAPAAPAARPKQPAAEISAAAPGDRDLLEELDQVLAEIINGRDSGWPGYWRSLSETQALAPIFDLLPSPSPRRAGRQRRDLLSIEQLRSELEQQAHLLKGARRGKVLDMIETWFVSTHRWHQARARFRELIDRAIDLSKAANSKQLLWDLERLRPWTANDRNLDLNDTPSSAQGVLADLRQRRQELAVHRVAAFHGMGAGRRGAGDRPDRVLHKVERAILWVVAKLNKTGVRATRDAIYAYDPHPADLPDSMTTIRRYVDRLIECGLLREPDRGGGLEITADGRPCVPTERP